MVNELQTLIRLALNSEGRSNEPGCGGGAHVGAETLWETVIAVEHSGALRCVTEQLRQMTIDGIHGAEVHQQLGNDRFIGDEVGQGNVFPL